MPRPAAGSASSRVAPKTNRRKSLKRIEALRRYERYERDVR
jgi:hypothetical protein